MMSLRSIALVIFALLFFAAGAYLFFHSTQHYMESKERHADPGPHENPHDKTPSAFHSAAHVWVT